MFREAWRGVVPSLSESALELVKFFLDKYPRPISIYSAYRALPYPASTIYKSARALKSLRILREEAGGYVATAKAAIVAAYHLDEAYLSYVEKFWGLGPRRGVYNYLLLLGAALRRLGFKLQEAYICDFYATPMYIIPFLSGGAAEAGRKLGLEPAVVEEALEVMREAAALREVYVDGLRVLLLRAGGRHVVADVACSKFGKCGHASPLSCPRARRIITYIAGGGVKESI